MPSENPALRLRHIVEAIDEIAAFSADHPTRAHMTADRKTIRAIERCFQIISEAARKMGAEAELFCPGMPWHDIRGMGNRLRHEYDAIDRDILLQALDTDLPALRTACIEALRTHFGEDLP